MDPNTLITLLNQAADDARPFTVFIAGSPVAFTALDVRPRLDSERGVLQLIGYVAQPDGSSVKAALYADVSDVAGLLTEFDA